MLIFTLGKGSYNGYTAFYFLLQVYFYFGSHRKEQVYTRTEFDKPQFRILYNLVTFMQVPAYFAGQLSGYLADKDLEAGFLMLYHYCIAFVLFRRLRMPGYKVFPRMVFLVFHHPANRVPVNMHIGGRHKN